MECGAFTLGTFKSNISIEDLNTFLYYGKTKTGTFNDSYVFGSKKPIKQLIMLFFRNPNSFVFDGSVKLAVFYPNCKINFLSIFGIFTGVGKEIFKYLVK